MKKKYSNEKNSQFIKQRLTSTVPFFYKDNFSSDPNLALDVTAVSPNYLRICVTRVEYPRVNSRLLYPNVKFKISVQKMVFLPYQTLHER